MDTDHHIDALLVECSKDNVTSAFAWTALQMYRARGLAIARSGVTSAEKAVLLDRSRERLRADLCDLLQPMLPNELPAAQPATSPGPGDTAKPSGA